MKKIPTWAVVLLVGALAYVLYRVGGTAQIKRDIYNAGKDLSKRTGGLIPEPSRDFWIGPAQPSGGGFGVGLGHLFPDGLFPDLPVLQPAVPTTASAPATTAGYQGFQFGVGLN